MQIEIGFKQLVNSMMHEEIAKFLNRLGRETGYDRQEIVRHLDKQGVRVVLELYACVSKRLDDPHCRLRDLPGNACVSKKPGGK